MFPPRTSTNGCRMSKRFNIIVSSAIVLLTSTLVFGVEPTLTLPEVSSIKRDTFGVINATGEFKFLRWKIPAGITTIECKGDVGHSLKVVGPPGTYKIQAVASNEEGITDIKECLVTIVGDGSTPIIDDKKKEDVIVVPEKFDGVHLIVVEEQLLRTVETIKQVDKIPEWRKLNGIKSITVYDVPKDIANVEPKIKKYIDEARKFNKGDWSIPVIIVAAPTGQKLAVEKFNTFSVEGVKKWIK